MDEISRRRFEMISEAIAQQQGKYIVAMKEISNATLTLEGLLNDYLSRLERVIGETHDTRRIRDELERAWTSFNEPETTAAIEGILQSFDRVAMEIGQLVGTLPQGE